MMQTVPHHQQTALLLDSQNTISIQPLRSLNKPKPEPSYLDDCPEEYPPEFYGE
ncbi:hypothetical protein [Oceanospirillum beijerinckii]|uniref:hypothetical protein n=1 Tax=Oceanospirillum beijerinckii TaxID=64976 RepID=UPI0012FEF5FE|nr:hypothetical protein [Oceanospirillum beijerinckii]